MQGTIFKIKKYALHDGPGIRTTVFFKGCPLVCPWCHNPEGIDPRPQLISRRTIDGDIEETVGEIVGLDDLMSVLEKDTLFYDESGGGVTFSGGEPLLQPSFLEEAARACTEREIHTALDTSGHAPPEVSRRLFPLFRLVLYDLKTMDEKKHRRLTGVSNRIILQNLETLDSLQVPFRIRIPVIPGLTDDEDNIRDIVRFVQRCRNCLGIDLLPYHGIGVGKYERMGKEGPLKHTQPPPPDRMTAMQNRFASAGLAVTIGGQP